MSAVYGTDVIIGQNPFHNNDGIVLSMLLLIIFK